MSAATTAPGAEAASPEVFHTLGLITRQLHDALAQLGVMPGLQAAAAGLPDARSRLSYIAAKTGEAAERVLNSVDQAKREHTALTEATQRLAGARAGDEALAAFVADVQRRSASIDAHLTDILLAQDFHDLTGQVVAKVVSLAGELEDSLVKLLLQAAPPEAVAATAQAREGHDLQGPTIGIEPRGERVSNQGEVDDLLASLGF